MLYAMTAAAGLTVQGELTKIKGMLLISYLTGWHMTTGAHHITA